MRVAAVLSDDFKEAIDKFTTENRIVLFMKGTKQFPQCGFSNTTVQILNTFGCPYETVRETLSRAPLPARPAHTARQCGPFHALLGARGSTQRLAQHRLWVHTAS